MRMTCWVAILTLRRRSDWVCWGGGFSTQHSARAQGVFPLHDLVTVAKDTKLNFSTEIAINQGNVRGTLVACAHSPFIDLAWLASFTSALGCRDPTSLDACTLSRTSFPQCSDLLIRPAMLQICSKESQAGCAALKVAAAAMRLPHNFIILA